MASKSKLSVVLDIGTSKLVAIAGHKNEFGNIEISGIAKVASRGIKRGVVSNIEEAAIAINQVLKDLEAKIEEKIENVNIAFAAHHFTTLPYQCSKFTSDEGVVSQFDIEHLMNEAAKVNLEAGFKLIKVIPKAYVIDGETEINPVGITGREVVANYNLLIVSEHYILNFQRVFDKIGFEIGEISHSTVALSEAVLSEDEREMGVIILDIGAGTTKMAVYHENMLIHSSVIPFGGDVVTRDIKEGCSILLKWAEQLKVQYGQALGDFADDHKMVTISAQNGWEPKEISFKSLAFIIQARMEEIIDCVAKQIEKSGIYENLGAGIVVTGGTANLKNIISLVKFRTGMDARIANLSLRLNQKDKEIQSPENFTALGMLNLITNKTESAIIQKVKKERRKNETGGGLSPWFSKVTKVVQGVLDWVDDENEDVELNKN